MTQRRFNADDPIAYLITWTTYGTWLPGDERGWQKWGEGVVQAPNAFLKATAESRMKEPQFALSAADREIVEQIVAKHCEFRDWKLHKVNARSNHVHVVVTAPGYKPEVVRDQFKAWCTRELKKWHSHRERFWTEGASCRYLNYEDDLHAAIEYAGDGQNRKPQD
jgi:REP element-mobilizing transposase RayT